MGRRRSSKAGAGHREQLWRGRADVVRQHAGVFSLLALGSGVVIAAIGAIYAVGMDLPFLAGFAVGSLTVAIVAALLWVVDGAAGKHNLRFGSYGEEATARLFETRSMRRAGWEIVHNMPFEAIGDVDHVAVGPAGVIVIESKWANTPWTIARGAIHASGSDPTHQAWRAADKIKRFLATKGIEVQPQPVLLQWGPAGLPDDWTDQWIDDVLVVRRPRSTSWLEHLGTANDVLDLSTRAAVVDALHAQLERARSMHKTASLASTQRPAPRNAARR